MPQQMDDNEWKFTIDFIARRNNIPARPRPCLNLAAPDLGIAPRDSYCLRRAARKINLGAHPIFALACTFCLLSSYEYCISATEANIKDLRFPGLAYHICRPKFHFISNASNMPCQIGDIGCNEDKHNLGLQIWSEASIQRTRSVDVAQHVDLEQMFFCSKVPTSWHALRRCHHLLDNRHWTAWLTSPLLPSLSSLLLRSPLLRAMSVDWQKISPGGKRKGRRK